MCKLAMVYEILCIHHAYLWYTVVQYIQTYLHVHTYAEVPQTQLCPLFGGSTVCVVLAGGTRLFLSNTTECDNPCYVRDTV